MKPKEKEFCRQMAFCGDPERAAREAGYRSKERWKQLLCRDDIASEIRRCTNSLRAVYQNTAVCGLYRMIFSKPSDALKLLYRENPTDAELEALELYGVAEIKRTKDKSVEIKFFDRVRATDKLSELLNSSGELNSTGGLLEAMRMSAEALGREIRSEGDNDGV